MPSLRKPWIKLREKLDHEDCALIRELEEICLKEDGTALKLELDYKLASAASDPGKTSGSHRADEFLYFDGDRLIGYLGLCGFGGPGAQYEANGMVHPEYRRQGVFRKLYELAKAEWESRESASLLLLGDRNSAAGQAFLRGTGARYEHSEYEMVLDQAHFRTLRGPLRELSLRKASNEDAGEIARQDAIYWGAGEEGAERPLPEDEEKRGMTIYLAEKDGRPVGKVHLQLISGVGGIYGLGVLPEHRGQGLGRAILTQAVGRLLESGPSTVLLQVAADNEKALDLYRSCGFRETSTMDYYEWRKERT